jgi:hypothetical protein
VIRRAASTAGEEDDPEPNRIAKTTRRKRIDRDA